MTLITDKETMKAMVDISYKNEINKAYVKKWYAQMNTLFEIVKVIKNKETIFLQKTDIFNDTIRWGIKAFAIRYLMNAFEHWNFLDMKYNMYYTLANYKYIPTFSYKPSIRNEQRKEWSQNHTKHIINYDFALDFDMPKTTKHIKQSSAYKQCKQIKQLFDDYSFPYTICFSGAGWHIRIHGDFMEQIVPERDKAIEIYRRVAKSLREMYNASTLDTTIYDDRRIWKCEYSVDISRNIVLVPLTDEEFENFNHEDCKLENVLERNIFKRGLHYRKGNSYIAKKLFDKLGGK